MNIRVDLNTAINDGTEVVFRSPVDCSQVTGLKVYYPDGSKEFVFADAHGNNVGDIDHLFAENVAVKVILDVTTGMAFVQNADTNAYLEGRFEELQEAIDNIEVSGGGGGITREELDNALDGEREWAQEKIDLLGKSLTGELSRVEGMVTDIRNDIDSMGYIGSEYFEDEVERIEQLIADNKAVIVTVSGSTPSHTSQQIYALIQEGKVVYLQLWGNTFTICTACTASEAKFENSYVNSITGADGKSYSAQVFRLFIIKNGTYAAQSTTIPAQTYVDAQIQYYLNK